jgi:hypothetical protein
MTRLKREYLAMNVTGTVFRSSDVRRAANGPVAMLLVERFYLAGRQFEYSDLT